MTLLSLHENAQDHVSNRVRVRRARWLHPGAWWAWALCAAGAASLTTNPLILAVIIACLWIVVVARRPDAPWGRSFEFFLTLGVIIVLIRVLAQALLGGAWGSTPLVVLPQLELPAFLGSVRIGGPVMAESLIAGFYDGLRLATIIIAFAAAQSLASPSRLMKSAPSAVYHLGVSVTIAMTFLPMLVSDIQRARTFRRLRGRPVRGIRGWLALARPVLHSATERSLSLAASMDARGYGSRNQPLPPRTVGVILVALVTTMASVYALMSASVPRTAAFLALALGVILLLAAVRSIRTVRTVYRPDMWGLAEWAVTACGILALASMIALVALFPVVAHPISWPQVNVLALGVLALVLPAALSPRCPDRQEYAE